jgi:hypothetical protein
MKSPSLQNSPDSIDPEAKSNSSSPTQITTYTRNFHKRLSQASSRTKVLDTFKTDNPLNADLVRLLQAKIIELQRDSTGNYTPHLSFNNYYEILLNKLSKEELNTDIKDADLKTHQAFFLKLFNAFQKSLLSTAPEAIENNPQLKVLADELRGKPSVTYIEMLNLMEKHPILKKYAPLSYQEGIVVGQINAPFVHVYPHRLNPEIPKLKTHSVRLYLSPTIKALPDVSNALVAFAFEKKIPLYFKALDLSVNPSDRETFSRLDRIVIFTDEAHTEMLLNFLKDYAKKNPQAFLNKNLPLAIKFLPGISIAPDPTSEQKQSGPDSKSFNSHRAKILSDIVLITMKKMLLLPEYSEVKPRQGRTLKQIFIDYLADEYIRANNLSSTRNQTKSTPKFQAIVTDIFKQSLELKIGSPHYAYIESALENTFANIAPNITPESLASALQASYKLIHKKYQTDPENITFNA